MKVSANIEANTVSARNQLSEKIKFFGDSDEALKVLFVGNSITRHGYKAEIGWNNDWGMAASAEEKDYVHLTVKGLERKFGKISACIAQIADWECGYQNGDIILESEYKAAQQFGADIIIIRIGENIKRYQNEKISCKPHFDSMIKFFSAENPCAKIIVTDCFWKVEQYSRIFVEVAKENGYVFCSLEGLEDEEGTMAIGQFEHDGVAHHPSDYGMKRIAERVLSAIGA